MRCAPKHLRQLRLHLVAEFSHRPVFSLGLQVIGVFFDLLRSGLVFLHNRKDDMEWLESKEFLGKFGSV